MVVRTYDEVRREHVKQSSIACIITKTSNLSLQERKFIEQLSPNHYRINPGFVPGMNVPGVFYVNDRLQSLLFEELHMACERGEHGGFLPAVKQIANVAALPGIISVRRYFAPIPQIKNPTHNQTKHPCSTLSLSLMFTRATVSPSATSLPLTCPIQMLLSRPEA